MTIGDNIKRYRKEAKITQTDLANRLNKSLRTIQKYESYNTIPSLKVLGDIAKALDITINDLTNQSNHGLSSQTKGRKVLSEYYSKECNNKPVDKELIPIDFNNPGDMKILINGYLSNLSDDELITCKNKLDYKEELNNQVPLYEKLEPKQLELLYLSKINDLNSIIQNQKNMINRLEKMVELQDNMINILNGGNNGK